MAAPVPVSSFRTFLGIAPETTQGTAVTTPTYYFRPDEPPDFEPISGQLEDKGLRASPNDVYNIVAGLQGSNVGWKGPVFPDILPFLLNGLLGEIATSGASAPYSHTITLLNSSNFQPKTYTLIDNYAAECRAIPGFMFDEVSISGNADGLLAYTTKGQGWASDSSVTPPTPSFTALTPLAAWQVAVTLGGSASTIVLDWTVNLKRNVNPIKTADGTQQPSAMWGGLVMVDGTMTLVMESDTELNRFLNNTTVIVIFDLSNGAGAALVEVKLTMSKVQYTAGKPDRSGDFVKLPITFKALGNTTDVGTSSGYSPVKALIKNAVAAGAY